MHSAFETIVGFGLSLAFISGVALAFARLSPDSLSGRRVTPSAKKRRSNLPAVLAFSAAATPLHAIAAEAPADIPSPTTATVTLLVPAGAVVPVHVVGTVSSGSAKIDDYFPIQVAEDVVINNGRIS